MAFLRRTDGFPEESYRLSMGLLSPAEVQPTFGSVLRRVEGCRELL